MKGARGIAVACGVMWRVASCFATFRTGVLCRFVWRFVSFFVVSCRSVSFRIVSCRLVLCRFVSSRVVLRRAARFESFHAVFLLCFTFRDVFWISCFVAVSCTSVSCRSVAGCF